MNAPAAIMAAAAACLAALLAPELRPRPAAAAAERPLSPERPLLPEQRPATRPGTFADTVLARPLFSQDRRPSAAASPAAPASSLTLPRMTGILIDGPRRSAIFSAAGGKPVSVAEGGRIGPYTVQTIEPQTVTVVGPEGKRTVRTSFDPDLQPPSPTLPTGLAAPQFPGIGQPGLPFTLPPQPPAAGDGPPQSAGAAR